MAGFGRKPKTPEQIKKASTDKKAYELAKKTPTSGRQSIYEGHLKNTGGRFLEG